jgi:phage terminase small subunit
LRLAVRALGVGDMAGEQNNLTLKQQNFVHAYLETGNASEAYRRAYDAREMKPESVGRKAAELMANGKITAKLDALREPVIAKVQLTLESHLETLRELRDEAAAHGFYGAAINAEVARGKASGLYVERKEIAAALITPASLLAALDGEVLDAEEVNSG